MKWAIITLCLSLIGCTTAAHKQQPEMKPVEVNKMEMDSIISAFTDAINKKPDYAGAYYNRALAYYFIKDYDRSWKDVHVAESLGMKFSDEFLNSLRKASGRQR